MQIDDVIYTRVIFAHTNTRGVRAPHITKLTSIHWFQP